MKINKNGNTYKNYQKIKSIWGGIRLGQFVKRWYNRRAKNILFKRKQK